MSHRGWKDIHFAAQRGDVREIERLLASGGADVNAKTEHVEATPLHIAAVLGQIDVVRLLIERGARVDVFDFYRRTPLNGACEFGQTTVVAYLCFKQADVNIENAFS